MNFNPDIKLSQKDRDTLVVHMKNMPQEYANGLRRSLHSEAPTVCIDKVQFTVNKSSLTEEYMAHRLGMIPIHVDTDKFEAMDFYYACKNLHQHELDLQKNIICHTCMSICSLMVSNTTNKMITVTDRDIKFEEPQFKSFSVFRNCQPVPILRLGPNQSIGFKAILLKAKGRVHAKWSPVAACALRPRVTLDINNMMKLLDCEQTNVHAAHYLNTICCKGVFKIVQGQSIQVNESDCIICDDCLRKPFQCNYTGEPLGYPFVHENGKVRLQQPVGITVSETQFQLLVESAGVQSGQEIIGNAINALINDLEDLQGLDGYELISGTTYDTEVEAGDML
ncbi:DNA-directed_RNA polymerase RPB3 [Hexamita inflata]|uniref:DNA-directed RNA polymerase RPB3 n=1 Tax=Hexamita inflata TaxID=28002 RepID=A0AA86P1Y6_9EUKA|nr:DNA-directed RNA polymerase RPB3 [Hexamita inflata]